ncbi:MAG: spondin domain-containing protein [Desulfobacterales bacterium]|nr:spondin domain-containing protein [Desulfobacterales bacterium]
MKRLNPTLFLYSVILCLAAFGAIGCNSSSGSGVIAGSNTLPEDTTVDATYRVVFDATWSMATHPDIPGGPHFSPLIGAVHKSSIKFWEPGTEASDGVELMAETGSPATLAQEVRNAITDGTAGAVLSGSGTNSPGSASITFEISEDFPLVTLVTMIAPSPDWFTGIRDIDLREDGEWVASKSFDLFAYDAGTDSGETFNAANDDTQPPEVITRLETGSFRDNPVGTFTFTRM